MRPSLAGATLTLLLIAAGTWMGALLHRRQQRARDDGRAIVYLPPPSVARYASVGHRQVVADYFWLQALQYYGEEANRKHRYRDLHRYLDLVVQLDPDFRYAYQFGGTAIPYNTGNWTWHNVDRSTALITRGVERFPDEWRLWLQLGFNLGVIGTDFAGAAEAYRRAAASPGAPSWIPQLVTRLYATAGAVDRARAYAEEILLNSEQPEMQEAMRQRLKEIEVEDTLRRIDEAIARYREERGETPRTIKALVDRYLPRMPEDPLGGEFYIEHGEARSSSLAGGRLRVHVADSGEGNKE